MVITQYNGIRFGDNNALRNWLHDHNLVHWNLSQLSTTQGNSWINNLGAVVGWVNNLWNPVVWTMPGNFEIAARAVDLNGPIDPDWLQRHRLQHQVFTEVFLTPTSGLTPTATIDVPNLDDEQVFYQWMQAHNDLHRQLDEALGLT